MIMPLAGCNSSDSSNSDSGGGDNIVGEMKVYRYPQDMYGSLMWFPDNEGLLTLPIQTSEGYNARITFERNGEKSLSGNGSLYYDRVRVNDAYLTGQIQGQNISFTIG
ncbi:hypothetical protein EZMO1_1389 [Endozoicomonas montiporae CL-33]|nr:hypothetical protein EZMO1_1389 [Endozoicomonas montiporae CL-33]